MNNTLTLARDRANDFARLHLQECAVELLRWKKTSLLPTDGRVRELAKLCSEIAGPAASLSLAEATVYDLALQALSTPDFPTNAPPISSLDLQSKESVTSPLLPKSDLRQIELESLDDPGRVLFLNFDMPGLSVRYAGQGEVKVSMLAGNALLPISKQDFWTNVSHHSLAAALIVLKLHRPQSSNVQLKDILTILSDLEKMLALVNSAPQMHADVARWTDWLHSYLWYWKGEEQGEWATRRYKALHQGLVTKLTEVLDSIAQEPNVCRYAIDTDGDGAVVSQSQVEVQASPSVVSRENIDRAPADQSQRPRLESVEEGPIQRALEIINWISCRSDIAPKDMTRLERSSEELTALLATISQAEAQPT
ncbi:hypothetical protein ACR3H8_27560 [Pseudomonas aeruginosa]|uniref:Uncharacterized protein n=5 Tax=Pseudomonas TaxID=286 RepID=A0A223Q464_PSEPU|nr:MULTISPECIES: hypothetical protein [Pseudomonas]AJA17220.1 hypothetical protein RPPX_28255 [Pseudomonas putida S12]ANI18842.1 hypothetical protein A9C11_32835 [Pseudomonas citronellolis]ANP63403.1 hypothetical protein A9P90_31615 [Pseudomonas aeruginosa]ARD70488.1 Hypothetical protein [Pseudomonas aeruginosa]ASU52417.1 Hypothetical protein [Pseudomonas putida]